MNDLRFRAVRPSEAALAAAQSLAAFGGDPSAQEQTESRFRSAIAAGELWGVEAGGGLVAHCRLSAVDHFFGGRPVRCMDVAGVAVPEQHRRRGVATALLEAAVAWGAHEGLALSVLFPGVPSLYRKLGWEHAGTLPRYRVQRALLRPRGEQMRRLEPGDWPALERCHLRYAMSLNGAGRRRQDRWRRLLRESTDAFVLDGGDEIEAYALVYRGSQPGEGADAPRTVDWAATTPRGLRAVLAYLAGPAGAGVQVRSSPSSVFAPWTDTWDVAREDGLYWMARALLLGAAVESRGFPAGVEGVVTVAVDDVLVPESNGPWRLEVAGGRGRLTPAATADVVADARAVGPLFTGFATPSDLSLAGLLDGPTGCLELLGAMFGGPSPVALDFF